MNQITINTTIPETTDGEIYIGAFINADGTGHHTILIPGDNEDAQWQEQMDWAKSKGGDLPNRAELLTMYEKFSFQFEKSWYWSNTTDRDNAAWAWFQNFDYGFQYRYNKDYELRARAVRRVPF